MEIIEKESNGLKRVYELSKSSADSMKKVEDRLLKEQESFEMQGFRKGKVPLDIVKKRRGDMVMKQAMEEEVDVMLKELYETQNVSPALPPSVEIKSFAQDADLVVSASFEIFPKVPEVDWSSISVETIKVDVSEEDLKKAHEDIIKNFKDLNEAPDDYVAKKGDHVVLDFIGKIDDVEFEGSKGKDVKLELGSGQFVPGFEDQLLGAKAKSSRKVKVMFPKDYQDKRVAGKVAIFSVDVKQVLSPSNVSQIDAEFAKKMGLEGVQELNEMIKGKVQADFDGISRLRTKKILFDQIDENYKFDIPDGMIKIDFEAMWAEAQAQRKINKDLFKDQTDEELKEKYKEIAKRRVRLGILLADIAKNNNIEVLEADLKQAAFAEAMQRPGQETMILEYYEKPENLERLRGPILEEKAVDHVMKKVTILEKKITSEEFFANYANDINPDSVAV